MKRFCFVLTVLILSINVSHIYAQKKIKLDYKTIARDIVKDAATNEEKAKAIYQYLCQNIAYDVGLTIYTAEECYTEKKGTCQGYALLFVELCKAVKVKCTYVSGVTKDVSYNSQLTTSNDTHAYLLVEGDNKNVFFVDPTWGAGSVENGKFIKKKNDMSWFNVEPEWMIFSHFPSEQKYQELSNPLTMDEYLSIPDLRPHLKYFGFDGKKILEGCRNKTITSMPQVIYHPEFADVLTVVDIPLQESLEVGETYTFTVRKKNDVRYILMHNNNVHTNWKEDGENLTISCMPDAPGRMYIAFQNTGENENNIYELINYQIPTPTPERYKELIARDPYFSPQIQSLPNYCSRIKEFGFDGNKILEGIENKQITSLPMTYAHKLSGFKIIDVPCNGHLKVGTDYRFMINLPQNLEVALIFNDEHFTNWTTIGDSMRELMFTPENSGTLTLNICQKGEDRYQTVLKYTIDEPTEKEWLLLIKQDPYYSKVLREFPGFSLDLKKFKFDAREMLKDISKGTISELVTVKHSDDYPVRVVNMPHNKMLVCDSTYVFHIVIPGKGKPAIKANNEFHSTSWQETEGVWEIQYTPIEKGELNIIIIDEENKVQHNAMTYSMVESLKTKRMIIDNCLAFLARQHNVVMATVGHEDGLPKAHQIPVLKFNDELLYFAVSPGRNLYWQLEKKPYVELMGINSTESIHIGGEVSFDVSDDVARSIYEENEMLRLMLDDYKKLKYFTVKIVTAKYNKLALTK